MSVLIGVLTTIEFTLRLCLFCVQHDIKCKRKAYEARKRIPRERFDWADFRDSLSSHQFRRMFRMSKMDFDALCQVIITAVGEEDFKPESYIKEHLITTGEDHAGSTQKRKKRRMYDANCYTTGGYINGETKLAITLRLMTGGSFLDIAALYCCGYSYTNEIFHSVVDKWICNDDVIKFEGLDYIDNVPLMMENARAFSNTGCYNGILSGVIGSLDGWLVKIRRPKKSDMVGDITSFYCRKGFYAVNVQAIVNKEISIVAIDKMQGSRA